MKYIALALSIFSLFVISLNTSCVHGNKYPKETLMLDSLQILVIKADSDVVKIDSAKITGYGNHIMNTLQLLQMAHIDSMSPGAAAIFRDFNAIRWSLLTIAGKRGPLLIELGKSQKQLSHLSHDLKQNLVASDSVSYYVNVEAKRASELVQVSNMSFSEMKRELPLYTLTSPKVDSLLGLVKEHKKF
jgi:hypothetical protein